MNRNIIIGLVVLLVAGGALFVYISNQGGDTANNPAESLQNQQGQQGQQNLAEPVATVNGEEITRAEMQTQLQTLSQSPQAQQASQSALQETAITQLVDNKLLIMAAKDEEITADESEVQNEMDTLLGQFENEEQIDQQLQQVGMSRESLRQDVRDQLVLQQYFTQIAQENDVQVTDEEVQNYYDQQVAGQQNAPNLDNVRPQIESQLRQQKIQPFLSTIIETYRESADIQILI